MKFIFNLKGPRLIPILKQTNKNPKNVEQSSKSYILDLELSTKLQWLEQCGISTERTL